jgi:ubiquinone/menaquinone biosynthesis C-methylase UbiE
MTDDPFKRQLVAAWDAGARQYDAAPRHGIRHDDEWVAWRRLMAAILGDPSHADVPRRRVLDVGTGTGVLAMLAAELGHDVTGIDLSAAMLAEARQKAAAGGLGVEWRVGDAEDLPDDMAGFDVVVSRHLLWTLPHPDRALHSWRSAATPGGLIAVIDGVYARRRWPMSWAERAAAAVVERRRRDDDHAHDYGPEAYRSLPLARQPDTRAVERLLRGAGLEHVRIRNLGEVDRVERAHQSALERLADGWRRYLATGRTPAAPTEAAQDGVAAARSSAEPTG